MPYRPLVRWCFRAGFCFATAIVTLAFTCSTSFAGQTNIDGVLPAAGQSQWIRCSGTGSPTVVISSGLGAASTMWSKVLPGITALTRTCSYDRPGLGKSPARSGSLTTNAGQHAHELRALLTAAGEEGPFIVIGHSYAGMIIRAFAAKFPQDICGLMLLEGVYPGIHRNFLPSYANPWHEGGTSIDMAASEKATKDGPDLGSTPLVVITAGIPGNGTAWADRKWNAEQRKAALLSTNSVHWLARGSGHIVQRDKPAIVIAGVKALVAAARSGEPLSPVKHP